MTEKQANDAQVGPRWSDGLHTFLPKGYLKIYETERIKFKDAYDRIVPDRQAYLMVRKLVDYYKIGKFHVKFFGNRGGHASLWSGEITLPHNPSVGFVCHEVAHIHNQRKYKNGKHNKALLETVATFVSFLKNRDYFQDEFIRIEEHLASIRVPPTKEAVRAKKLVKVKDHVKRLETRVKSLQTRLKKWRARARRLERETEKRMEVEPLG